METKDFARNPALAALAKQHLVEGERLVALFRTSNRDIILTSERIILVERSSGWAVIRNSQIAGLEISPGTRNERFVKIFFADGSRTVSVPDDEQARVLASAAAFG